MVVSSQSLKRCFFASNLSGGDADSCGGGGGGGCCGAVVGLKKLRKNQILEFFGFNNLLRNLKKKNLKYEKMAKLFE